MNAHLWRSLAAVAALTVVAAGCTAAPGARAPTDPDPALAELRVDYATDSPPSLVLKKQGWLDEVFKGTTVKWVYSA